MKDWTGNKVSTFKTLGASNHTEGDRHSEDYYATDPKAIELLLEREEFNTNIWECACGEGHLAKVLTNKGYNVRATDLADRGYGDIKDFLFFNTELFNGDIITNPPYSKAEDFIITALDIVPEGNKVAMLLRLLFLEGKSRRKNIFDKSPPKIVYVFSSRILCALNGDFNNYEGGAIAYAWFVWVKGYKGDTILKWIN